LLIKKSIHTGDSFTSKPYAALEGKIICHLAAIKGV